MRNIRRPFPTTYNQLYLLDYILYRLVHFHAGVKALLDTVVAPGDLFAQADLIVEDEVAKVIELAPLLVFLVAGDADGFFGEVDALAQLVDYTELVC